MDPASSTGPTRILLVEDDEEHARIIQRSLERHHAPFAVTVASSLQEARLAMRQTGFDLVISDWRLPDGEGLELLNSGPVFPLLILTGLGNEQVAVKAMRAGALDYIVKSEDSLLNMPRIAEGAIRLWTNLVDKEIAQEKLRVVDEALREQKQSEALLRKSERNLRELADAMPHVVWTALASGEVDYCNEQWQTLTGLSGEELRQDNLKPVLHRDDLHLYLARRKAAMALGVPYEVQCRFRDRSTGNYRWHLGRAVPVRGETGAIERWVSTFTDIDDRQRLSEDLEQRVAERTEALKQSLVETTMLLKEVHHRVKNNLQVICSLLSMQISCSGPEYSRPLNDAHSRVLAMSLIHEQIYQSETLADLDFGEYIAVLSERLFATYCLDQSRIRLEQSVDAIDLTMDQAIPCGLILNELISNSLKHAFSDGRQGLIRVSLKKLEDGRVEMIVADNGRGLPPDFRLETSTSLGLQVVRTLIKQLRAKLTVTGEGGAQFRLNWKLSDDAPNGILPI